MSEAQAADKEVKLDKQIDGKLATPYISFSSSSSVSSDPEVVVHHSNGTKGVFIVNWGSGPEYEKIKHSYLKGGLQDEEIQRQESLFSTSSSSSSAWSEDKVS